MYGDYGGKRSLQCKPTMTKNFWEQDMEDLEVLEMCAVKGREEYLVCTIDTPRSIQLRSMKNWRALVYLLDQVQTWQNMLSEN